MKWRERCAIAAALLAAVAVCYGVIVKEEQREKAHLACEKRCWPATSLTAEKIGCCCATEAGWTCAP